MVERLPRLRALYGDRVAVDQVAAVCAGWAVLGKQPTGWASFDVTAWRRWIAKTAGPAVDCLWLRQFAPVKFARTGACNTAPFGHVDREMRRALRRGYLQAVEPGLRGGAPRRLSPPSVGEHGLGPRDVPINGGCMVCGVDRLNVDAGQAGRMLWHGRSIQVAAIGAPRRHKERAVGHCCLACDRALGPAGTRRPPKAGVDLAIAEFVGEGARWDPDSDHLIGTAAWAVQVVAAVREGQDPPPPNRTRFAHLGEVDQLRKIVLGDTFSDDVDPATGLTGDHVARLLRAAGYRLEKVGAEPGER
ncbi:MAG TPA: hypothetical protein VIP98_07515 [Microlunatus sp.]